MWSDTSICEWEMIKGCDRWTAAADKSVATPFFQSSLLYLCILYLYLCICIFICPPPSPHPHLVFAWWCGAGPELDHLYQFVSDYSHQVIVQLTHQKYIWQLRQIHLTINRNTFDNYDKYIWQFGQIALTICTTLSLIIATKSLCRSSSSATNKRQSKTDCLALITSTREG